MNYIYDLIKKTIESNDVVSGGLMLGLIASIGMYIRPALMKIWNWILYVTSISVELQDYSPNFEWLAAYACDVFEKRQCGHFYLLSESRITHDAEVKLYPAGTRWVRTGLCFCKISLVKRDLENSSDKKSVEYSLIFTFYGFGKRKALDTLIRESKEKYGPKKRQLYIRESHWSHFGRVGLLKKRPLDTIYSEKLPEILQDLDEFLASEEEYKNRGVPYRRGYLLEGKPGGGKSTIVSAMANHLKRDLDIVNLKSESSLKELFATDGSLIVIEDIDCAGNVKDRESEDEDSKPVGPSLSDILNAIDGISTGENIVFIFTTNHPDKLDPALIRPGRIDYRVELGPMTQNEFKMACKKLYGKTPKRKIKEGIMPAKVQQQYLNYKEDFEGFCEQVCD